MSKESTKYLPEELESKIEVDFDALIAERDRLENEPRMQPGEIDYALSKYLKINLESTSDAFKAGSDLLSKITERITKECEKAEVFSTYEEAFQLITKKSIKAFEKINAGSGTDATFFPGLSAIGMKTADVMKLCDPANLIYALASYGSSKPLKVLHHEFLHSKQHFAFGEEMREALIDALTELGWLIIYYVSRAFPGFNQKKILTKMSQIGKKYISKEILRETHAYKGEERRSDLQSSFYDFLGNIKHGYDLGKTPEEIDQIILASVEVNRLYALGLSGGEIGSLVRAAKWDSKKRGYNLLDERASQIMQEKGLDEEDVDNLVLADDLKRQIFINKTQLVAQEELKKAVDNLEK